MFMDYILDFFLESPIILAFFFLFIYMVNDLSVLRRKVGNF